MTRAQYQSQLSDLMGRLGSMADHAKGMLRDGVRAFETLDRGLAEDVDHRKEILADFDESIEMQALRLLALQNPMAGDLRHIGATLKIITYLNRLGRYGRDIGNVMVRWPQGKPHVFDVIDLPKMADNVEEMLDIVLDAFHRDESPDIPRLVRLENEVDTMRRRIWDSCLVQMMSSPQHVEACAYYQQIARYLERCGDNVCKMAEKLHYAATGERIIVK